MESKSTPLALLNYEERLEIYHGGYGSDYYGETQFTVETFTGDNSKEELAQFVARLLVSNEKADDQDRCLYVVEDFASLGEARGVGTGRGVDAIRVLSSYSPDEEVAARGTALQDWLQSRVSNLMVRFRVEAKRAAEEKLRRETEERLARLAEQTKADELKMLAILKKKYEQNRSTKADPSN